MAPSNLLDLVLTGSDGQPLASQDVALVAGDAAGAGFPGTAAVDEPPFAELDLR